MVLLRALVAVAVFSALLVFSTEAYSIPVHVAGKAPAAAGADSDGDGVPDGKDECPGTPKGTDVDEAGCPTPRCMTLNVRFDFNKAVVKPEFREEIKAAADFMKKYAHGRKAVLEGYTDSLGGKDYNKRLSDVRAIAVRMYMVDNFGIDPNMLSARGFGESKPIADNKTEEGRAKNRRVVLRICE